MYESNRTVDPESRKLTKMLEKKKMLHTFTLSVTVNTVKINRNRHTFRNCATSNGRFCIANYSRCDQHITHQMQVYI